MKEQIIEHRNNGWVVINRNGEGILVHSLDHFQQPRIPRVKQEDVENN